MNNVEVMEEAEKKSEREEESKAENKKESGQVNNSLEENAVSTQEIEVSQEIGEENSLERFEEMLDPRVLRAVKEMGFEKLSPIQVAAIPALMEGSDIIGQAQTGTGKTAAFGIPLIQRIDPDNKNLQAVILCPTRELAIQAAEELRKRAKLGQFRYCRVIKPLINLCPIREKFYFSLHFLLSFLIFYLSHPFTFFILCPSFSILL